MELRGNRYALDMPEIERRAAEQHFAVAMQSRLEGEFINDMRAKLNLRPINIKTDTVKHLRQAENLLDEADELEKPLNGGEALVDAWRHV